MFENTQRQNTLGGTDIHEGLRSHLNKIYGLLSAGVLVTFALAYWIGNSPELLAMLRNSEGNGLSILGWIVLLGPLGLIFFMGAALQRASEIVIKAMYFLIAGLFGASLSVIFQIYTETSIAQVFLITSAAFAGLSLWGYTTKKDISGWGAFLFMGLLGLIVASIINLFVGNTAFDFAISVIGVLIFAGFTAYDTQRIKTDYLRGIRTSPSWEALSLYLDFINLFIHLLSLLGNKK